MLLAQYTIRMKEDYIFKTNRILDIVGASVNISNAWDLLIDEAKKLDFVFDSSATEFRMERAREYCQKDAPFLMELYRGGGNYTVLLRNREDFINLNRIFSYRIITEFPGMIPMAVSVVVTDDYAKDYLELVRASDMKKNSMAPGRNEFLVPFAMADGSTYQALVDTIKYDNKVERVTAESRSKRQVGLKMRDASVKFLDSLVTERGRESLLAIVHADGNGMGNKIQNMFAKDAANYDFCVNQMRRFTQKTAEVFTENGLAAMEACKNKFISDYQKEIKEGKIKESAFFYRVVVADGDDITFICNARMAMEYVKAYTKAVSDGVDGGHRYSSCAGICIFHSHYPFARAYDLAEQCCDNAKKMIRKKNADGKAVEECWVDFHYIHAGVTNDLTDIRFRQRTADIMARPWRVHGNDQNSWKDYEKVEQISKLLMDAKVSRTTLKNIGAKLENSISDGLMEYKKACGHACVKDLDKKIKAIMPEEEKLMQTLYDMSEIYDLWLGRVK